MNLAFQTSEIEACAKQGAKQGSDIKYFYVQNYAWCNDISINIFERVNGGVMFLWSKI